MQRRFYGPDRGFDFVQSLADSAKVSECGYHTNGSVAAHSQIADIIEKDNASSTGTIGRFNEAGADYDVGAARFVDDGRTQAIVLRAQGVQFVGINENAGLVASARAAQGTSFLSF